MTVLQPCSACQRHIAATEASCPFCRHEQTRPARRELVLGRVSRAVVFASASIAAACGGKAKASDQTMIQEDSNYQNHPCSDPDEAEISRLEKEREQATTDEEKQALDQRIETAKMPVCAPYGAPPARRRIV